MHIYRSLINIYREITAYQYKMHKIIKNRQYFIIIQADLSPIFERCDFYLLILKQKVQHPKKCLLFRRQTHQIKSLLDGTSTTFFVNFQIHKALVYNSLRPTQNSTYFD